MSNSAASTGSTPMPSTPMEEVKEPIRDALTPEGSLAQNAIEGAFIDRMFIELKSGESISLRDYQTNFYRRMTNSAASTPKQVTWRNRLWPAGFVAEALAQLKKQRTMDMILKEYEKRGCYVTKEEDAVIVANSERELDKTLKWQDAMEYAESLAFWVAKHMEIEYIIYRSEVESECSIVYPVTPFARYLRDGNLGAWYLVLWSTPVLNWSGHEAMLVERHSMIESITYRKEVYDFLNEVGLLMTTKYWHEPIMPSTASVLACVGKDESRILALRAYRREIAKEV